MNNNTSALLKLQPGIDVLLPDFQEYSSNSGYRKVKKVALKVLW